jgi:hypothetical protein
MKRIVGYVVILLLASFSSFPAFAGAKLQLSVISKWEIIGICKVVGYVSETPYVFVSFCSMNCPNLTVGGNFTLRAFSPSMQENDTVILNGKECRVSYVEGIRQN